MFHGVKNCDLIYFCLFQITVISKLPFFQLFCLKIEFILEDCVFNVYSFDHVPMCYS